MARSLGLVLGAVIVVVFVQRVPGGDPVKRIDYSADLRAARSASTAALLAPEGLSPRWRPTSSSVALPGASGGGPVAFHVGFVTPEDHYAALEETDGDAAEFIRRHTARAPAVGAVDVDGVSWQQYRDRRGTLSLSLVAAGETIVVTGGAPLDELRVLAAALR